jgi:hypothetical protein
MDWSKFDQQVDNEALAKDVAEAQTDYPDIPDGEYDVTIRQMELGTSKKKDDGTGEDPMLKIQFQIMAGEFKGQRIFYNGVMKAGDWQALQIHNVLDMLRSLADAEDGDDEFKWHSFSKLDEVINNLYEEVGDVLDDENKIAEEGWHYKLEQKPNSKNANFKDITILEILE